MEHWNTSVIVRARRYRLSEAYRKLQEIPYINEGGCGVAALALYRWAKKHGLEPQGFALLYDRYELWELQHNRAVMEEGNPGELEIPSHVALKYNRRLYDSNGYHAHRTCRTCYTQVIDESALLAAVNQGSWNSRFERDWAVPKIERLLGIDLSDVWTVYTSKGYHSKGCEL